MVVNADLLNMVLQLLPNVEVSSLFRTLTDAKSIERLMGKSPGIDVLNVKSFLALDAFDIITYVGF